VARVRGLLLRRRRWWWRKCGERRAIASTDAEAARVEGVEGSTANIEAARVAGVKRDLLQSKIDLLRSKRDLIQGK